MAYAKRIVLNCPSGYQPSLDRLVEEFLHDNVELIAITGRDCAKVEYIVDELIVGKGDDPNRFMTTTSHDSLKDALEFAESWLMHVPGHVQIVEI